VLLSVLRYSGDEDSESQAARNLGRAGSVCGFGDEVEGGRRWGPGDPAARRLDAPGVVERDINGTVRYGSSRRLECWARRDGEDAEMAEEAEERRPSNTTRHVC